MADTDYLCVYRQFFEEFAKSFDLENQGPVRLNICNLLIDELVGEIMQICVNFLTERQCPNCLVVHLTRVVVDELLNEVKKQPEQVDTPLKLNKKTLDKISEVCHRYTDNEKLSSLPGPARETPFCTHSTKHTRRRMEDRHICLPRFNTLHGIQSNSEAEYYGIFDGHAGVNAACYSASHLHQFLAESKFYPDDPVRAFQEAYEKTDSRLSSKDEQSGTTSLAILHQPNEKKLTVSWVGDSEALLVSEDFYVMLVDPHKPERPDESKRINDLGGCIFQKQGISRVNGGLAISRALGDTKLKPCVGSDPEFRVVDLTGSEHFVVMASDGLWNVVTPQEVMETVYFEVKKNNGGISTVAKRLVDLAKENDSDDNITVVVIFLTHPSELSNRSIDVTGHRPKIILQNGVIMEANFQPSEKLLMNESGLNGGVYETNGNHNHHHHHHHHFGDPLRNESDEDLGPETDVDALEDVLTTAKAIPNPFGSECWQKIQANADNWERLMEMGDKTKDGFSEDFAGANGNEVTEMKFANSNNNNNNNNNANEKESEAEDMFAKDEVVNVTCNKVDGTEDRENEITPNKAMSDDKTTFEESVINNHLDLPNAGKNNGLEDAPGPEVNSESDKMRDLMDTNFQTNQSESTIEENDTNTKDRMNREEENTLENCGIQGSTDVVARVESSEDNGGIIDNVRDYLSWKMQEENAEKEEAERGESNGETTSDTHSLPVPTKETPLIEKDVFGSEAMSPSGATIIATETTTTTTESLFTINDADHLLPKQAEDEALDASKNAPEPGFVENVAAPTTANDLFPELSVNPGKSGGELAPEQLEPSAPVLEGEIKDEVIAESGGEVEDSEDDEWNYFKVESGVRVPVENTSSDLASSVGDDTKDKNSTMNSPLNPDAAEFIPVSPMGTTPVKTRPQDLSDIVASSPNWANMGNVTVPEESAFLMEIKSRPSNITEDLLQTFSAKIENNKSDFTSSSFMGTEMSDEKPVTSHEPRGIELAKDMTGSFIDTTTMSSPDDTPNDKFGVKSPGEPAAEPAFEQKHIPSSNEQPQIDQMLMEPEPGLPDVVSSPQVIDVISPVLMASAEVPTPAEVISSPESDASTLPIADAPQTTITNLQESECKPVPEAPPSETVLANEKTKAPIEFSESKDEVKESIASAVAEAGAGAALAAGVVATVAAAVKEDEKKAPAKAAATAKTPTATRPSPNETKTTTTIKRTSTPGQPAKSPLTAKTSSTKTTVSKVSSVTKTTTSKSPSQVSATLTKAPARPKPTTTTSAAPRAPVSRTSVTTTTAKPGTAMSKAPAKTTGTTPTTTARPKPRVPSAPVDKKTTVAMNGDAKTGVKRTETTTATKRPTGTSSLTATRVTLSARPATAPARTTVSKTTVTTTTRTVAAKPRTLTTTTTSTVTSAGKPSLGARKPGTIGTDKQAKEMANRITSRITTTTTTTTTATTKMNGVPSAGKLPATTLTKRRTLTTTTTKTPGSPAKTKTASKTEIKAEKVLDKSIESIQSEKEKPLTENNKDFNLINNVTSD